MHSHPSSHLLITDSCEYFLFSLCTPFTVPPTPMDLAISYKPTTWESIFWGCIFQHVTFSQVFSSHLQTSSETAVLFLSERDHHLRPKSSCPPCHSSLLFHTLLKTLKSKPAATDLVWAFMTVSLYPFRHFPATCLCVPHRLWSAVVYRKWNSDVLLPGRKSCSGLPWSPGKAGASVG